MTTPVGGTGEGGCPPWLDRFIFANRRILIALFSLITLVLAWPAAHLSPNASFDNLLPQHNAMTDVYKKYRPVFGSVNGLLVAIESTDGDILTPQFFDKLQKLTDDVFFLPGVDRSHVSSLVTPDVRYIEVVEDGFR